MYFFNCLVVVFQCPIYTCMYDFYTEATCTQIIHLPRYVTYITVLLYTTQLDEAFSGQDLSHFYTHPVCTVQQKDHKQLTINCWTTQSSHTLDWSLHKG